MLVNAKRLPVSVASSFIALESYMEGSNLIVTKIAGENKTFVGRVYEMSPLIGGGAEFSSLISSIFKNAPDDSVMQCSLISAPDYEIGKNHARNKIHGNDVVQELVGRQSILFEKALTTDALRNMPCVNKKRLIISFSMPVLSVINEKFVEDTLAIQNEFLAGLKSSGFIDAQILAAGEVLGVYRQFANIYDPRKTAIVDETLDLRRQVFAPSDIFDFSDEKHIKLGNVVGASVSVKSLPEYVADGLTNILIGSPMDKGTVAEGGAGVRLGTPYIFTTTIRLARQAKEQERLVHVIENRRRGNELPIKLGDQNKPEILSDLIYLQDASGDGVNKIVYTTLDFFAFGKNKREVDAACSSIKSLLNNLKFDARQTLINSGVRFVQTLPLNFSTAIADGLNCESIMPASAAACLCPIYGDNPGNSSYESLTGSTFLTRRGSAYYFDKFKTDTNKNGIIFASSGAGKSFLTQYLIANDLAEGTRVFMFDNGRSAKKFCQSVGGEYLEFTAEGNQTSLNPFSGITQEEFVENFETIVALILKMCFFNGDYDDNSRIAIEAAVTTAYEQNRGKTEIRDVINALKNSSDSAAKDTRLIQAVQDLIPKLESFMSSQKRGSFFKGPSNLSPNNQFTVFELAGLDGDEHLKQVVLFFVMNAVMNYSKKLPGRKAILLDEAWQLLRDDGAAAAIEGMYRKIRKDNGSVWVITQDIEDLAKTKAGGVIIGQSKWQIIMKQEASVVDNAIATGSVSRFSSDPYFVRSIKDVTTLKGAYSEICIVGDTYEIVRLYVDRFTVALFSTDGEDRDVVFNDMKNEISAIDSINALIKNHKAMRKDWISAIANHAIFSEGMDSKEFIEEFKEAFVKIKGSVDA